jgi:hypothetical protein
MLTISLDETHHIKNDKPLYDIRYKRVMNFHNGIAPVETDKEVFFINEENEKLFNRVFKKAYGFYEGKSAVKDKDGWFHIDLNGNDLYSQRYSWVGNFNENRCVVRDFENNYFHIDEYGNVVYKEKYSYVGDFKYGIAVVINDKGSTHIDRNGNLLHKIYFEELNIFHKGYAIAKVKDGYFHINKQGNKLYKQRYKKLEDFYNGCALATTFDDNKIVLNEEDFTTLQITKPKIDKDKILNESFGYFKYQILFAILKLDILKKIDNKESINLPNISKKLIFRWLKVQKFIDSNNQLTDLGKTIEYELKNLILYWQDLPFKTSSYMIQTLIKGDEYFSELFKQPYFNFLENNSEYAYISKKMNEYYTIDYANLINYLNFSNEVVCDIGGGSGKLIKSIQELYPNIKIFVADKFSDNIENFVKIDFFQEFKIKADIFLLSRVLHDWNNEKALKILQNISKNMQINSILYIFETIVPMDSNTDKGTTLSFHLLNFVGGYERDINDFKKLFKKVNLEIIEIFEKEELISLIKVMKI